MKSASLVLALCAVFGCSSLTGPEVRHVTGTVRFNTVEGGFYYIRGDDSVSYTPTNLFSCLRQDGLRIQATLKIEKSVISFLPGTLVEIQSIESPATRICAT